MELQEIIKKLKFICNQEGLVVTPTAILEQSVKLFISYNIDKSRKESKESDKPSDKQINLLNKLKIKIPDTKKEATILIRENINKEYQEY